MWVLLLNYLQWNAEKVQWGGKESIHHNVEEYIEVAVWEIVVRGKKTKTYAEYTEMLTFATVQFLKTNLQMHICVDQSKGEVRM